MITKQIRIGESIANVEVSINNSGFLKSWSGTGVIIGNNLVEIGEYDTEIGKIVINKIYMSTGEFHFTGSGRPKFI